MFGFLKRHKQEPFNPEKDTGETTPVRGLIAVGDIQDKFSTYPSNGLTPRRLARILKAADEGDVREQMELFEEMEEKDTHLFSQIQTRKLTVTGLDWEIQPFSDDERDKDIAEFVSEQLKSLENMDDIFIDMLDAIGKGVSIMEIEWGVENSHNVIENIEYVHPKKLIWDPITDEIKICTREFPTGVSLPKNKFVVHRYKAKSGHTSRAGILRIVSWMYLFKNYDIKDWVSFAEVFGMPLRLGKYNASASDDDKKALMEAIYSLGTDAAGIVPDSTIIEFIESNKTTSIEIYEKLARYCDEQISKAVLGQTLSSDSGGGSYAQGKVHNEVRHDLTVADAKSLAVTIRRDIIRPLVEFNYGQDVNIPLFSFDCKESDDQKEAVEICKTLACDMGLEISKNFLYKKFNIPKPEDGDEILNPVKSQNSVPMKLKAWSGEQNQVDRMSSILTKQGEKIFAEMIKPILNEIDKCDNLETLKSELSDKDNLEKVYKDMYSQDLEELLSQGMYLASLMGRSISDG